MTNLEKLGHWIWQGSCGHIDCLVAAAAALDVTPLRAPVSPTERLASAFWPKVARGGADECWQWLGRTVGKGYGALYLPPDWRTLYAHRVSFELAGGTIPDGLTIDHLCRNKVCVNPAHMEVVTRGDNPLQPGGAGLMPQLPYPTPTRLRLADAIAAGQVLHYHWIDPWTCDTARDAAVTARVAELVAAGLAEIPDPPDDLPESYVRLTPDGMAWVTRARTEWRHAASYFNRDSARVTASAIRCGKLRSLAALGRFEGQHRVVDGEFRVYVRYLGPVSTSPETGPASEIERINEADRRCRCKFLGGSCAGECCGYGECSCTPEVLAVLVAAAGSSTENGETRG